MPIVSVDVKDGDPAVQANGEHRGTVVATFSDGRTVERRLRAPDLNAWNDLLAAISATIQTEQSERDAQASVAADGEVAPYLEASSKQVAVAYLRNAWEKEQAYDAYLLFDRFNTYRLNQGWTLDQVAAQLLSAGLEQEEWDEIRVAYQYLSGGGRPDTMANARTIQGNWETR